MFCDYTFLLIKSTVTLAFFNIFSLSLRPFLSFLFFLVPLLEFSNEDDGSWTSLSKLYLSSYLNLLFLSVLWLFGDSIYLFWFWLSSTLLMSSFLNRLLIFVISDNSESESSRVVLQVLPVDLLWCMFKWLDLFYA
jgi:hypothetical protein